MASLASVPLELLALIFTYLHCFADLSSVAGVCKDWRNAIHLRLRESQQEEPRCRQLPWLLQPSYDTPPSTITSYVSGTTGRRICLPEGVRGERVRFCGSHEGGWVAVAADPHRRETYYELVNLINQAIASIPLPNMLRSQQPRRSEEVEIRMVTFSDVPTAGSCIAAAHTVGSYPSIIFCRPHQVDGHWVPPLVDTESLQDTLYHRNEVYEGFYAISNMDNLYVFLPGEINNSEPLVMSQLSISFPPALVMDNGMAAGSNITRYLVESRGKLLLVLRYSSRAMGMDLRTLHFRVFEMEIYPTPNEAGYSATWVELHGLDGRVITIARGCSRAFEAEQYKGFQGGSIYYLDDAVGAGKMHYVFSFADLGMYSMGETKIERPGLPTPELRGSLDGDGALRGRSSPRHPSQPQATEFERLRWLLLPRNNAWDGRTEHLRMLAGCEPASNTLYGPRELMVRTIRNLPHADEPVISRLQIVSEIDHAANDEASSSTSAGGEQVVHETVASVWPLLCKPGNRRSIWFLPPSANEWLLPPPAAADA